MSADRKDELETLQGFVGNGRANKLKGFEKLAAGDQHGAFQHFQSNVAEYATRDRYIAQRGGEPVSRDREGLYGIGPEHEDSYVPTEYVATHLSTRYSPDRVGVQAMRVSDGVFQDPYTNKVYDYNEGFKTEDGRDFPPGHAALQTSIMNLATHLDKKGLVKEATYLDVLLRKNSAFTYSGPNRADALSTEEIMTLMKMKMEEAGLSPDDVPSYEIQKSMQGIDKSDPWVRERLGLDTGHAIVHEPGADEPSDAEAKGRENRPLTTGEIAALFKAHEDPSSDYKLDPSGLAQMTNANLSEEEAAIVDGMGSMSSLSAEAINNLIKLATHLDRKGLTKEATYLDVLLRKNV